MAFDGSEGAPIDLAKAVEWTTQYREKNPGQIKAYFFGRGILEQILAQGECMGIRVYYGLEDGVPKLMAVGADSKENDQLGEGRIVADLAVPCPPTCGTNSVLNE